MKADKPPCGQLCLNLSKLCWIYPHRAIGDIRNISHAFMGTVIMGSVAWVMGVNSFPSLSGWRYSFLLFSNKDWNMHLVLICLFSGCSISYLHKNFAPYDGREEKMTQIFGVKAGFLLSKKYMICAKMKRVFQNCTLFILFICPFNRIKISLGV